MVNMSHHMLTSPVLLLIVGTANGGSSTGVTVAITVVAVIAGLALVIITVLLVYRQTRGRS